MKKLLLSFLLVALFFSCSNQSKEQDNTSSMETDTTIGNTSLSADLIQNHDSVKIHPLNHASFVIEWNGKTIYNDPHGSAQAFASFEAPDIILISDVHGDHMNPQTLDSLPTENAAFVMPQAVAEKLPSKFSTNAKILANGEEDTVMGFTIKAIPMYNLPETADSRHVKGRGNGYVITLGETKVYIAGDTEDIPEMRSLTDIDIAFVPMNLPYTMTVEQAADGVIAFAPKIVYPYHYRGQDGLADISKFKELVDAAGKDIEVRLSEEWY